MNSWRAEVRNLARVWVWYRVSVRDRFRFRLSARVRVLVRVGDRSQEAPDAEPTAVQWSPRSADWSTQWMLWVRVSLSVARPDNCLWHSSGKPQECSRAQQRLPVRISLWVPRLYKCIGHSLGETSGILLCSSSWALEMTW